MKQVTVYPVVIWILVTSPITLAEPVSKVQIQSHMFPRGLVRIMLLAGFIFPAGLLASEDLSIPPVMVEEEVQSTVNSRADHFSTANLINLFRSYIPKKTRKRGNGLRLARLFGDQGVAIKVSKSMPDSTYNSLLAGSGGQANGLERDELSQAFVYAQKRW